MTRVSRIVGLVALLGTSIVACGARTGLDAPKPGVETVVESDGGTCTASNVAVEPNVPNLYFILDISTSMVNGPKPNKWDNIRPAVAGLIAQLGANARFAAWVFPTSGGNGCNPGSEIMGLRLGDTQGAAANAFTAAVAGITPNGGTPTAATFQALLPVLKNLQGETFAILVTDGGPNCDTNINTCPIDQCTSNIDMANPPRCNPGVQPNCCDPTQPGNNSAAGGGCLDGDAAARAVSDLRAAGVRTYVMGIPGVAPYASVLDQLAVAGGTARTGEPRYFAVNSSDETALASGLQAIAAAAMRSCVLTLHDAVIDPNKVNVYVDGAAVRNGPDGWSLHGQTVTLQGMTCAQFGMSSVDAGPAPVRVTQGCPTVR